MTLCPSAPLPPPLPPPPTLSSNVSAAQVVFVAVPRATRTMQRFVIGEKYFTFVPHQPKKKKKEDRNQNTGGREGGKGNISPASDAPTSPQPTSPKFKSTLCFSALKTSLLDIVSGDGAVMRWIWPCPGVETDGGGDAAGMNSMRNQRFYLRAC